MMKNIKDITISIFAIIGFVAIITGFQNLNLELSPENQAQSSGAVPETHIWKLIPNSVAGKIAAYQINAVTGEVRFFEREKQIAITKK